MGFSTIGTGTGGGGGGSAQQVNFSVTASASQTISALYIANSIVDVAGLLVAIQNTGGSAITLTAASGSIVNTTSYPVNSTSTTVVVQPNATVVLETNLANLDYFINSYSNIANVYGGAAGQLLWQSAANTTGFVPTGTAGYILQSNGTAAPSWVPVAVPNVQGGFAGQVLYQTATNSTGFVTVGTTGQYLVSNGTSAPSWMTLAGGNGTTITTVGSTTTIKSVRSYTFSASGMTSGQSFVTFLSGLGVPDADGNQYTIYNNTGSTFTLVLPVIVNYFSYNYNNGYFISGSNVYLQANQSINIQTVSASISNYSIMSTTESQGWSFAATISSQGALPASTDTVMNFTSTSDPVNAFNNTTHKYVIPKAGLWFFSATTAFGTTSTAFTCNIQIRVNNNQKSISFNANTNASASFSQALNTACAVQCNVGDEITVTNWISAGSITVGTGGQTSFSGSLAH